MGRPYVAGGTPVGSASMCHTCEHGQIMTGYRESDRVSLCTFSNPAFLVPFAVHTCTMHEDKARPSWEEMTKLALDVTPGPLKPVGFRTGVGTETKVAQHSDD